MKLLNFIEIETRWGFRSFELYSGDITTMDKPVDLLACSILEGSYLAKPYSVVGALAKNHQLNLAKLVHECEFDLRQVFGCWVSEELPNDFFKRLLCVELGDWDTNEIIENAFVMLSILEAKGIEVREFALPVLGTGSLKLNFDEVVRPLLEHSLKYLQHSQSLQRVKFVEIDESKAAHFDESMNDILGRVRAIQPNGKNLDNLKKKISRQLENIRPLLQGNELTALNDLSRIVSAPDCYMLELNTASRRLLEVITSQMATNARGSLNDRIEDIRKQSRYSDWIPFYMHLIRVFGNSAVHANNSDQGKNPEIGKDDIEIGLICLSQIVDLWGKGLIVDSPKL